MQAIFDTVTTLTIRFLLLGLLVCTSQYAMAQFVSPSPFDKGPVDPQLLELQNAFNSFVGNPNEFTSENPLLQLNNGYVVIDVATSGNTEALKNDLEQLGMTHGATYGRVVSGRLPIDAIDNLAVLPTLRFVRASAATVSRVGLTTSQGDASMHTDDVRNLLGFDGTGITVGVLSDTYDNHFDTPATTAADDIANDDLPANGVIVLDEGAPGIDEGRAMLQLIHDAAPGANLAFHTAFGGQANFASGIVELAEAGADVIVDDIIYFAEPMFQDGIIAQAADEVAAMGIPYFSAAGNQARQSYESDYRPSGTNLDLGPFGVLEAHDFDPGPGVDVFQQVTLGGGGSIFSFQWDEPFFSASGAPGSASDLDFCLFTDPPTILIGCAAAGNVGFDPVEIFLLPPLGTTNFAIVKYAGPDPTHIKFNWFSNILTIHEYATNSGTSYGHSNAAGASSVGAARYTVTPAFGVAPPLIESFSSAGQIPIFFDTNGHRLPTPELRGKPDIVAPDGTNTTFFGSDLEPDGFPNFFGTSAAAPHAAAAAALLLQYDPSLTPNQIYGLLEDNAIDMDDPFTAGFDEGFDERTGHGLIHVLNIFSELDLNKEVIGFTKAGGINTGTFLLTVTNHGPGDASDVAVSDVVPVGATFVSATPGDPSHTYDPATGVWTIGDLANGTTATLSTVLTASSDDFVTNVATIIEANRIDMDTDNNVAGAGLSHGVANTRRIRADLRLEKTVVGNGKQKRARVDTACFREPNHFFVEVEFGENIEHMDQTMACSFIKTLVEAGCEGVVHVDGVVLQQTVDLVRSQGRIILKQQRRRSCRMRGCRRRAEEVREAIRFEVTPEEGSISAIGRDDIRLAS